MLLILIEFLVLFPLLFSLFIYDRRKRRKEGPHLYGIEAFHGLAGHGKTISMTKKLIDLREKYGDSIYIMTNYFFTGQDFAFNSWTDLLKTYDKPLVVAWDEAQNLWTSREWKFFPTQLIGVLTQVRKGHGIYLLYTTQKWHMIDKNFRTLTHYVNDCRTWLGRYTIVRRYICDDFEERYNTLDSDKKRKIKPKICYSFVQTNKIRNSFNSYKMLESAKKMQYMSREELAAIENIGNNA